jgi:hypothetical protein
MWLFVFIVWCTDATLLKRLEDTFEHNPQYHPSNLNEMRVVTVLQEQQNVRDK